MIKDTIAIREALNEQVVASKLAERIMFDALVDLLSFHVSTSATSDFSGDQFILSAYCKTELRTNKMKSTKTSEISELIKERLQRFGLIRLDMISTKGLNSNVLVEFKAQLNLSQRAESIYQQDTPF